MENQYKEVSRNAEVGETIKVVYSCDVDWLVGDIAVCTGNNEFDDWSIDVKSDNGYSFIDWDKVQYVVLEPINQNNGGNE